MPSEKPVANQRRIAVIGAGITGMGAAHLLSKNYHVTLYEAEGRLGGHARTIIAGKNGDQPVDTGFLVFNYANYPRMAKLFAELDVPVTKSNMSFGASIGGGKLEYALTSLGALFAQKRNALNPKFLRMIRDIFYFNANAVRIANEDRTRTTAQFLSALGTGDWFRDYYLLPLSGAIWSTPIEKIIDFPAHAMVQFFEHHALLNHTGQHQWYTVQGGSVEYVKRLETAMKKQGADIRLNAAVQSVSRNSKGVTVKTRAGGAEAFDQVIFATHADDSLAMLADPTGVERTALSPIKYQPNDIVLHCDESIMPKRKQVWSSWVYTEDAVKKSDRIDLTYWINSLQPVPKNDPHFVTLNTKRTIREECIYDQTVLRHPVYDLKALAAQDLVRDLNGANHTWFCGAWMRHGFHEDGYSSAVDVADAIIARDKAAKVAAQ